MQIVLAIATVLGFALTAGNIIAAYVGARKQLATEDERIATAGRLFTEEMAELKALSERTAETSTALHAKYKALYESHGLVRPSYDNLADLSAYESRRLVGVLLTASRGNLIWAGVGLLISTVASVVSLFI